MTPQSVVDMRDLDPTLRKTEPDPVLARQFDFLGAIVSAGSVRPAGETATTPLRCPARPHRRPCTGRLAVTRLDIPSEIRWRCATCGKSGTLVGWRKTVWDLSSKPFFHGDDEGPEIELLLSQEAYDLVRRDVLLSDPDLDRMVAGARWTKRGVVLSGTADDLEEFAGCVAFVANRARNRSHQRLLDGVMNRIDEAIEDATPEDSVDQGARAESGHFAEDMLAALRQAVAARGPASLAELQAIAGATTDAYNSRPQAELGGLSPHQAWRLLEADWEDPSGWVALADDLPFEDLAQVRLLANARTFLETVAGEGGVKTTTAGNLNRVFVGRMLEAMAWPEGFREEVRRWNKVINEHDVRPLHILRILLYGARLLRRWKGTLRTTKLGESLAAEERAGELFAILFRTHFRRFNLAYLDMVPETHEFQHTVAYSLYRFGQLADDWRRPEDFAESLVLPAVRQGLPPRELYDPLAIIVEMRLLRPLVDFGLADERIDEPAKGDEEDGRRRGNEEADDEDGESPVPQLPYVIPVHRYRKTALFDRLLTFRPGPP